MALLTTELFSFVPKTFDTPVSQHGLESADTLPYPLEKYLIIPEEKVGLTGMMKASLRCPNPGTGIFFPRAHGNIRAVSCTAWQRERSERTPMKCHLVAGKSLPNGLILREAITARPPGHDKKPFFWRLGSFVTPSFGAPAKYLKPYEKISPLRLTLSNPKENNLAWIR